MGVLLLVRHGQASFGAEDYDVLSAAGHEQGRLLGRWLAAQGVRPDAVLDGGMRRHRETLDAVLDGAGDADWDGVPRASDGRWAEFDFTGLVRARADLPGALDRVAFQRHFEVETARWTAGDAAGFAESYADFCARVRAALLEAAARTGTTLVVTSGGPVAAVAAGLVADGEPPPGGVWSRLNTVLVNSSVSRVVVGRGGARLLTFNEHAHLARDEVTYR